MAQDANGVNPCQRAECGCVPFESAREQARETRERQRKERETNERVCDAAMPSDDQQLIVREYLAQNVRIGKNCAEHQRPSDDPPAIHRSHNEQVLAAEDGLSNQRACNSVGDGVHGFSVPKPFE